MEYCVLSYSLTSLQTSQPTCCCYQKHPGVSRWWRCFPLLRETEPPQPLAFTTRLFSVMLFQSAAMSRDCFRPPTLATLEINKPAQTITVKAASQM